MIRALILIAGIGLGTALMGCSASAEVGDAENDRTVKKTTTVDRDGDRSVKTEVKRTD